NKAAEDFLKRIDRRAAALQNNFALGFIRLSFARVQSNTQDNVERARCIVGDMNIDAVQTLVRHPDSTRRQCAAQEPVRGFGHTGLIEDAPASAGFEIRTPQDNAAAAL